MDKYQILSWLLMTIRAIVIVFLFLTSLVILAITVSSKCRELAYSSRF